MTPTAMHIVAPSRLQANEPFSLNIRLLGPPQPVPSAGGWRVPKPGYRTPYNVNIERNIRFHDNTAKGWTGTIEIAAPGYHGPTTFTFDGTNGGIYTDDGDRPIITLPTCRLAETGFQFIHVTIPSIGLEGWSNPIFVTADDPGWRLVWGDPHTHTYCTDAIRCPEDIYHFARHEGFLDFCALTDHSEGITDGQWLYFQAVTNAANAPGEFATLIGQEWTNHLPINHAPGHRNIYVPGDGMPILRCTSPECGTLDQLWSFLDTWKGPVLAIPHHSANVMMGTDWDQPWNPRYERSVEIYSVWGNSERSAVDGNPRPILSCGGEQLGRHVQNGLAQGRRLAFLGGGDTHDGRPGDAQHDVSYPPRDFTMNEQGFTAAMVPALSREHVFDAIATGHTYATTATRLYLEAPIVPKDPTRLQLRTASEEGIAAIAVVHNGSDITTLTPHQRVVEQELTVPELGPGDYRYLRITTEQGRMAWSSPHYGPTH